VLGLNCQDCASVSLCRLHCPATVGPRLVVCCTGSSAPLRAYLKVRIARKLSHVQATPTMMIRHPLPLLLANRQRLQLCLHIAMRDRTPRTSSGCEVQFSRRGGSLSVTTLIQKEESLDWMTTSRIICPNSGHAVYKLESMR
jgi:hypothetical protein